MLKTIVKTQMLINDFKKNIEGASLIEYSILIGLISAAVIGIVITVGAFVTESWTDLQTGINDAAGGTTQ